MKIIVRAIIDKKLKEFEIPCGEGDKSFKWLSNCVTQRFALCNPNGTLRSKESFRGDTFKSQSTAMSIILPNGESPHPSALICDYLSDGEVVMIELLKTLYIDEGGYPEQSEWFTLAFSTTSLGRESDEMVDGERFDMLSIDDETNMKGKAMFMRSILNSQLTDISRVKSHIDDNWDTVSKLMPKLSDKLTKALKATFLERWPIIVEVFQNYAPLNMLMKREMTETDFFHFIEDAEIFSLKDFEILTKRVFRRIKGNSTIDLGGFITGLILISQTRHVDIFDKNKDGVLSPVEALDLIIEDNLIKLAQKLNVKSFLRIFMFSDEFLSQIRDIHEDLFKLYEKYTTKMVREIALTLNMDLMASVLYDSALLPSLDPVYVQELFDIVRSGMINGRSIPIDSDLPASPESEYTFAEFIEAVARINFRSDGVLDNMDKNSIVQEMVKSFTPLIQLLHAKPVEPSATASKNRK